MHPTAHGGEIRTVAQWIEHLAAAYLEAFGHAMPGRHRQVLNKIRRCRTPALGGQLFECPDCRSLHYRYHSCNDRHCPQCGQTDADDWLQRQRARLLLPVPYFLVTFTVPEALRRFIRSHPRISLDLLFAASARALQDLAGNPRRLGAQLGMLGVLHTWSRTLIFHPHIHYLVPGGGLSRDGRTWVPARHKFLLHHKALGAHTRTLFKQQLLKQHPQLFTQVAANVWKRPWNVGCQTAGCGENALRYLSRYIFKTATANRLIAVLPDGRLLWRYRHSQTGQHTSIELEPLEFMRRFLQHTLPRHFARVRTFGWLHPAAKARANRVRALLRQAPLLTPAQVQTWDPPNDPDLETPTSQVKPAHPLLCPHCQKIMRRIGSWHPGRVILYPNRPP